jgi:dTDP-4-dehydrorhamnose reductase
MRVLIVGKAGQLASALTEIAAMTRGVDAVALGRPDLDSTDAASVARAMEEVRPEVVVNAAAYTAVDKAETEPDAAFALNGHGARLLADASERCGAAIIHVSTDYVFDGEKPAPYVETDQTGPVNVYGRSKLEGEFAVRMGNPRHLILRTAWVHSATGANFVRTMLRLAGERKALRVVDDQVGSPTYAPHLAEVVIALAQEMAAAGDGDPRWGTYHAAGTGTVSWCGLAREVFRLSAASGGPSAEVEAIGTQDYPTPARRPGNSRLDCQRLRTVYGLALPPWQSGVAACVGRLVP